jgi:integrase
MCGRRWIEIVERLGRGEYPWCALGAVVDWLCQLVQAVLRRALKQAFRWALVLRYVCDAVDPPRVPRTEIDVLSGEQVRALLQAAKPGRQYALFVLAIGTGMRMGESFGLQWKNADLNSATLQVCNTLMELKGKLTLTEPKTAKSRRQIDLPKTAVEALKAHRAKMEAEGFGDVEWIFCSTTGTPLRRSHFHANVFKPLLEAAGLAPIRFHDLRHSSASLLLAAGVHPKIVQERLGQPMKTWAGRLPASGLVPKR